MFLARYVRYQERPSSWHDIAVGQSVAYLRHGNISRLVGGRLQLGGFASCAQSSEGRVSALQHAVCLIVKRGAMWASLDLRSLCRMKIALFATVAAVSNPVINDKGTTCSGPKITSK
jgi:hypothetical protein